MPLLLQASPSFSGPWEEHLKDWQGEIPPLYPSIGLFAHHVVALWARGKTEDFPRIFDVVEDLHLKGDEKVREAATIGVLESLQNISGNRGLDPEVFFPFLKPESARWWIRLNDFWQGKRPRV